MTATTKQARITREQAETLRFAATHNRGDGDEQFMRRLRINGRMATVISHYCCVADRFSGYAHVDGDPATKTRAITWS